MAGPLPQGGHRITADRQKRRSTGVGYDKVHVAIDDTTRLAFYMVNTLVFLGLALSYYQRHGYSAPAWGHIVQWASAATFFLAAIGTMASMEKELE